MSDTMFEPSSQAGLAVGRPRAALARIIGLVAALACALGLLGGCSAIKIVYNTAPDFAYWWIDGYLDLNESQTPRVREELASLHQWHRTTELPRYAEMVQRASVMALADLTPDQVCGMVEEGRTRLLAIADHEETAAVWLATTVNADQLRNLERKYAKNNNEYRKDWLDASPKERVDRRYKQVLERSEMIYGRLDDTQRQTIKDSVAASSFDPAVSYAERVRRQRDALQTLRQLINEKPTPAQAKVLVRGYFERTLHSPNAAYRSYQETLERETCRAFAAAHNTTTPAQRETASRRLKAYERDIRELAAANSR